MSANSLHRTERLRSLGAVRRMFESGESGFIFPFRYVWIAEPDTEQSVEVLFSVPKKFHKRANKRNLLRRRTKEAYRLQKQIVHNGAPVNLDLALIYSSKEVLPYKTVANAVRRILESVVEHLLAGVRLSADRAGAVLPTLHLAPHAPVVPLHPHLLAICPRSAAQIRPPEGTVAHRAPPVQMPSVGRKRLRPGALSSASKQAGNKKRENGRSAEAVLKRPPYRRL